MEPVDAIKVIMERSGKTAYALSVSMGRAKQYMGSLISRHTSPRADTLAEIASACGCDLIIRDRTTGEMVAMIDPPAGRKTAEE